jgi:hypothetical protein
MKSAERQCFRLFQEIVVLRDVVCQRPGCTQPATAGHHVFGRVRAGTAFLTDSGLGLCHKDHDGWARQDPNAVRFTLLMKIGARRYEDLWWESLKVCRMRDPDFMDTADRLGVELVELQERKKKEDLCR